MNVYRIFANFCLMFMFVFAMHSNAQETSHPYITIRCGTVHEQNLFLPIQKEIYTLLGTGKIQITSTPIAIYLNQTARYAGIVIGPQTKGICTALIQGENLIFVDGSLTVKVNSWETEQGPLPFDSTVKIKKYINHGKQQAVWEISSAFRHKASMSVTFAAHYLPGLPEIDWPAPPPPPPPPPSEPEPSPRTYPQQQHTNTGAGTGSRAPTQSNTAPSQVDNPGCVTCMTQRNQSCDMTLQGCEMSCTTTNFFPSESASLKACRLRCASSASSCKLGARSYCAGLCR